MLTALIAALLLQAQPGAAIRVYPLKSLDAQDAAPLVQRLFGENHGVAVDFKAASNSLIISAAKGQHASIQHHVDEWDRRARETWEINRFMAEVASRVRRDVK